GATDAELFLAGAGSNGLAVDAMGVMYSATARKQEISKYDLASKTQTTVVTGMINTPNDIAIASNGTIYFSDPIQDEVFKDLPNPERHPLRVHMAKDGVDALFEPDVGAPNGVLLSPDEDILYVVAKDEHSVKKVTLNADGS